jgi:uncharacterized ParB-like nuclease family protein
MPGAISSQDSSVTGLANPIRPVTHRNRMDEITETMRTPRTLGWPCSFNHRSLMRIGPVSTLTNVPLKIRYDQWS